MGVGFPYKATKQMSRDDESNNNDEGGDKQLTRPQVALKEERYGRKQRGDDAAVGLRTEVQDDARHKAA